MSADGAVVSAEELLERVWDEYADPFTNAVAVTVMRLRRELGKPPLVKTVIGGGTAAMRHASLAQAVAQQHPGADSDRLRRTVPGARRHLDRRRLHPDRPRAGRPSSPPSEVSWRQGNVTTSTPGTTRGSSPRETPRNSAVPGVRARRARPRHVLTGGLGWAVTRRVLRPLAAVTTAAQAASQENLDQRLALAGPPDELKELADTFDAMLARLDAAFASQRRFIANASHELRTPLTEMRTLIDVTTARPAAPAAHLEPVLAAIGTAVDKSEELIEALLTLARSDRGPGSAELVDLPTAVEDAIDLIGQAAAARQIQIGTTLQDAQDTGKRVLLERLVSNLIENAVRHNVTRGLGGGQHPDQIRDRRDHRLQRRRAHSPTPGTRAVRAVPPPLRPDRQPARLRARPVHRRIGGQGAQRPRRGPRQARRRTGRADRTAGHSERARGRAAAALGPQGTIRPPIPPAADQSHATAG